MTPQVPTQDLIMNRMNMKTVKRTVLIMRKSRVSYTHANLHNIFLSLTPTRKILDDEDEAVDDERESGDGQEELESEGGTKKKVDHDEDRSNPQYIPKKGTFYEHDDRMAEDIDEEEKAENSESMLNSTEGLSTTGKVLSTQNQKITPKTVKKKEQDCWSHDRFNEYEQAPKSRTELVSAYGYDIRNEDGPPRPRRQRRYGRHQSKYDRNWEDEEAYKKSQAIKPRRPLRPEDFPALGSTIKSPKSPPQNQHQDPIIRRSRKPQDENDPQTSSNYRSPVRNIRDQRDQRSQRDDHERGPRDQRNQRYNNDTSSNNNNARYVKSKKNINFNHNIEFKNQNRKNINYESSQTKNNNVLNQQMQSSQSSSHQQHGASQHQQSHHSQQQQQQQQSSSHHHHHQSNQRYNNNEAPLPTLSFTNSKMNNATNNSSAAPTSSRGILNYDNSSSNYGRGSREKEVNSQMQHAMHNQAQAMSPNKNIQQYSDHQMDQMKLMEKNYQQQQGKATNLNLNQIPPQHQQQLNNMQDASGAMINNSDMSRSKRYSSLRQRSNLNEVPPPLQQVSQSQQQAPPQAQQYHPQQYHPQQEMDPPHVQNVQIPSQQQTQAYMPPPSQQQQQQQQPPPQAAPTNIMASPVQQQQQQANSNVQAQKYQAAYYAANPASEYALMQAAMVEKYQYQQQQQQQPAPAQYLPPPQAQQIYMPTQTQATPQQQILNYVSTIQPQPPTVAPTYPQYTNYQNYNIQAPAAPSVPQPQAPPPTQSTPIYQTQSGLTYFPNATIAPTHQQRIIQPQRRPNPIPILAPPDHKAKTNATTSGADDGEKNLEDKAASSAENIDHILDNMFTQRPMTNVVSLKDSAPTTTLSDDKNDDQINEGMIVSRDIYL